MRIAVLGAMGQLGRDMCPLLPGEVIPLSRAEIDLSGSPTTIAATIESFKIDHFVNCAAYNFVDRAETEPDAAFAVNAWGVRALARACKAAAVPLVHFSTDYVFGLDSNRTKPLAETDLPGPVSVYGLSKLAGEYVVLGESDRNLVIRTCGLYGRWGSGGKGGNFVETMLRLANQGKPLRVVNDQRCTPSYTVDVAKATASLIRNNKNGLFHVTNGESCSWYEFASQIFQLSGIKADLTPITSAEFGAVARRPGFSVLSNAKLAQAGVSPPPQWQDALQRYLQSRNAAQ